MPNHAGCAAAEGVKFAANIQANRRANQATSELEQTRKNLQAWKKKAEENFRDFELAESALWDLGRYFHLLPEQPVPGRERGSYAGDLGPRILQAHNESLDRWKKRGAIYFGHDMALLDRRLSIAKSNQELLIEALNRAGLPVPELNSDENVNYETVDLDEYLPRLKEATQAEHDSRKLLRDEAKSHLDSAQKELDEITQTTEQYRKDLERELTPYKRYEKELNQEISSLNKLMRQDIKKRLRLMNRYEFDGKPFKNEADALAYKASKKQELERKMAQKAEVESKAEHLNNQFEERVSAIAAAKKEAEKLYEEALGKFEHRESKLTPFEQQLTYF
jgi:hypothetical protein